MRDFIKKYKWIILINLLIFITYILISSTPKMFGIDDTRANVYIFQPNLTFIECVKHIINRAVEWNTRIGEILYFIVGCFPRWIYFLIDGLLLITFLNLVYVFTFGTKSKEFFKTKKYYISILINYLITLYFFPGFSETMIWMAGVFNHLFSITLCLIVCIPFRLLIDGYDIFEKMSKKEKIIYYILCFLAGFSVENVVPWLVLYEGLVIISNIKIKRNKNWTIKSTVITIISFIIFYILSSTRNRVDFFSNLDWAKNSRLYMFGEIGRQYSYIFFIILGLIILNIFIRKKSYKTYFFLITQFILSFISIIVLLISPYFVIRATILMFFFALTVITYLSTNLLFNKKYITTIFITILTIFMIASTCNLIIFYKDFDSFNEYRYNYIMEQKDYDEIHCPMFPNNNSKEFFTQRLTSYESLYCDNTYIEYLTNKNKIIKVQLVYPALEKEEFKVN